MRLVFASAFALALALAAASPVPRAHADALGRAATAAAVRRPVVGFRVRGPSKLTEPTLGYLARVSRGELVGGEDLPRISQALLSSGLFEQIDVALEDAPGGVVLVATLDDKHSWVIAPTVFYLPGRRSVGVGFAENNVGGENKKLLLYGQLGDRESLFFGTFLDPRARGSRLTWRGDVFLYRRINPEYANPIEDPTDARVARESTAVYLGGGLLVGWQHRWWLSADLRVRGARVTYRDAYAGGDPALPAEVPQHSGWDISTQLRGTIDRRAYDHGVTWGPFLQLVLEQSIPGLDDYGYTLGLLRAYHSWRLGKAHQLELRVIANLGRHLPFHDEVTLGGAVDLRGYAVDRYRADTRLVYRTEYSVPIARWRFLAFRALAFWDTGYAAIHFPRPGGDRNYLPGQLDRAFWRNDLGVGLRVYVRAVVLPLVGLDVAYGVEARAPEVYFQLGLTDF